MPALAAWVGFIDLVAPWLYSAGPDPLHLTHRCEVYANSTRLESFAMYAKYEWVQGGRYFKNNNTVRHTS